MLVSTLTFIVSALIALLFLKINIKKDIASLLLSYSNSSKLMFDLKSNNDLQQEAIFKELSGQFKLLFSLSAKFLLIISPTILIIIYTLVCKSTFKEFLDFTSIMISLASFLLVYLYISYGKPK